MIKYVKVILFLICLNINNSQNFHVIKKSGAVLDDKLDDWQGKWFPKKPEMDHKIPMGVSNIACDDAMTLLDVDWLDDPVNHTCFEPTSPYYDPDVEVRPLYEVENIPNLYRAEHACMNESIWYKNIIPTFGTHRPLWPQWGEYKFVPRQRWIHNLEHGGIVMLYHPCANKMEVKKLKSLVVNCLYRHIVTPYNLLSPERPLALVGWGRRLQMSAVSKSVVVDFIREAALQGYEKTSKDGQYTHELIKHSKVVSNIDDDNLCPNAG